ncbi:MAG: T9SS type A sorting domain-containing protein, partial [Salinivirgaceae bacterium]
KIGVDNLTWFEVNDFQVGDELHVLDESSCWTGDGYGSATTNKAIYKYLERIDYSDSIVYRYSRKQSITTTWTDSSDFKFYNDTLTTKIKPDSVFDMLPGEPIVTDNETYNFYMTNESPISKTNPRGYESFIHEEDSCWGMLIADGCLTDDKYIKGLGGPYYSCTQAFCLGEAERKLVYYKKSGATWGTPLTITAISDVKLAKNIMIYPNPAKSQINIQISNNDYQDLQIFIYNIQGKLQKTRNLELNNSMIDISDLNLGIYILKIADYEKILKIDRLIIE